MADENGCPTEMMMKKYEHLARDEVGAIITGYAGVQQNGKTYIDFARLLKFQTVDHISM